MGWFRESDWQSNPPRACKIRYPDCSSWPEWAKAYKPEWSYWLPKRNFWPDDELLLFEEELFDMLTELREVEAFVETKFKELENQA